MTNSNSLLKLKESEPPGAPSFVVVLIDVKENLNFKCFRHQKYIIVKFDERKLYGFLAFFTHLFFYGFFRLSETARLLRNVFKRSASGVSLAQEAQRTHVSTDLFEELSFLCFIFFNLDGYAFSQEEHGIVSQAQIVRAYDSTKAKPEGI